MTSHVLTPTPKLVLNSLDHLGALVGLSRLPEESNADYRDRLWEVFVLRAGSNFQGLINGICRELGLEQFDALTISDSGSAAVDPRIIVKDTEIEIYSDWQHDDSYTLESTIDIYSRDGDSFYLSDLITTLNNTGVFTASLASGLVDSHMRSMLLLPMDSMQLVLAHALRPIKRNILPDANIIGPVHFNLLGSEVFITEQATEAEVEASGDYYVDRENGVILSYDTCPVGATCSYQYNEFPFVLRASDVKLTEFNSATFIEKIFQQVRGENSLPMPEAVDLINELISAKGMLWGI